jgi:hypothetical protein
MTRGVWWNLKEELMGAESVAIATGASQEIGAVK